MRAISMSVTQFCQVENARKRVNVAFMRKIGQIVRYLFSPEDSRDTVYHEGRDRAVSDHLAQLKTGMWIVIAMSVAMFIAQLQ